MQRLERAFNKLTTPVTFTDDVATTGGFSLSLYSGATLLVTATPASAPTIIAFGTQSESGDGQYFTAADADNTPITLTVEPGRAYALPDALFACSWVYATTDAGTVTCQLVVKG